MGVTDPAEEYFKDGTWEWNGSAWVKKPLALGFSGPFSASNDYGATGAGNAAGTVLTVPAGEVYVVQNIILWHNAGATKLIQAYFYDGTYSMQSIYEPFGWSDHRYMWRGEVPLETGDVLTVSCTAPGDGKRVYVRAWGYTMRAAG